MKKRVGARTPIGILAYEGGEPVGWCSVAPRQAMRAAFADHEGSVEGEDPAKVWSIVCFYVPRAKRKQGLLKALLEAAVAYAKKRGARVVEAYPVPPSSPSYRYGGFVRTYVEEGFEEVAKLGSRRRVVRRDVVPASRLVRTTRAKARVRA